MNKKCIGLLFAIPALMGLGLASCSNEEPILNQEVSSTKQVEVSFIAELVGASRASLTFDENKNLKFKWDSEDVVYAINADNGKYLGKLTVSKVLDDPRNCEFKGTINLPTSGSANLKFYYLGEKGKMEFDSETNLPKDIEVDYSIQKGTAEELDDYDLLKAEKVYHSTDNGSLGRLSFLRHFSTAQFILKCNGEELNLNGKTVTISAASGDLYNKASLNYKSGEYAHTPGDITVTPTTNNFYVNLIPTDNVEFKFTVVMDNGTFEGTKSGKIAEDTYYSDNLDPIVVEMVNTNEEIMAELHLYANFEGANPEEIVIKREFVNGEYTFDLTQQYTSYVDEDGKTLPLRSDFVFLGWAPDEDETTPDATTTVYTKSKSAYYYAIWVKNPLSKWAEGDLVYNKTSKKSSVASSYTTRGSLYQWGRNIGWTDYNDAMGSKSSDGIYSYGTYGQSYATGTGIKNGYDDSCMKYTTASNLPANKDKYFMDPDGTDYWVSSFGDGGATWDARAKKCGWDTSICPEGYRMPTVKDFEAIKPSGPKSGNGSLSSILANVTELKDHPDNENVKVAWRWTSITSDKVYVRIDAKVVSKDFKEADLNKIDWTDKASVVTRYFGANGFIHGFKHINIVTGDTFPVARPMPGTEVHYDYLWQNQYYWTVLWNYITDVSKNNEGYYWASDAPTALTFQDNTKIKTVRYLDANGNQTGSLAFPNRLSVFGTLPVNAQDCCAIRCINTDIEKAK